MNDMKDKDYFELYKDIIFISKINNKLVERYLEAEVNSNKKTKEIIFTSKNVPLSKKTNWILPLPAEGFKEPCHLCSYYGHNFDKCPNIMKTYLGSCMKCWNNYAHSNTKACALPQRETPFHENFKRPEALIRTMGIFEE
ncbi:1991_t:CDS:1 [Entrophospora sp. SA101]|nr:11304_t:CDS:1 [Entrophospora sp. SA101]CAJ0847851.1 1991_t:CDS:1 [Entrophospora sp. SA101]